MRRPLPCVEQVWGKAASGSVELTVDTRGVRACGDWRNCRSTVRMGDELRFQPVMWKAVVAAKLNECGLIG